MPRKPVKERKARKVRNNRDYEARREATGMTRLTIWVPESERQTFVNAAKTYERLHMEKQERLNPAT